MNIEIGIGIGGGSLFAPTSNDRLIAYAWASALSPSVSTSAVIHATVNAVLANSVESALSPTVASAGNAIISSVIANANGNALVPSVAIAGSISVNAVIANSNSDGIVAVVSTIRNVSVGGVVVNSTASAVIPTVSTSGAAPTIIVQDSFNRADSSTSLGVANTGQTWITSVTYGISSNQAYYVSGASDRPAYVNANVADCNVFVTWTVLGTKPKIVFRYTNDTNYLFVEANSGNTALDIYKYNGAWTKIGTYTTTIVAGDKVNVKLSGSSISLYFNGVYAVSITETFNQTATNHGILSSFSTTRFDDFKVESL